MGCGRGGAPRVVWLLADSVTGLLWPPGVAERADQAAPWQRLFARARHAGLDWQHIRGVTRDGAQGLSAFLGHTLVWVQHPRCVWHIWRSLAGDLARAAAEAATAAVSGLADPVRAQVRAAWVALLHGVIDAQSYAQAAAARLTLRSHPQGAVLDQFLNAHRDRMLWHLVA